MATNEIEHIIYTYNLLHGVRCLPAIGPRPSGSALVQWHEHSLQKLIQTAMLQVRGDEIPWRLGSGTGERSDDQDIHLSKKDGKWRNIK
jgi:hypothetical protein